MVFMSLSRYRVAVIVMSAACVAMSYFQANPIHARQQSRDEQLIREARARSNAAIAAHDPAAMARLWMDDVSRGVEINRYADCRSRTQSAAHGTAVTSRQDTIYLPPTLRRSAGICRGGWRRSVGSGPPDGRSRTASLTWRERTWRNGVGSTGCG